MEDETILHQEDVEEVIADKVEEVIEDDLAALSTQVAIPNFVAITGGESPTEDEFNALGAKLNLVLGVLRDMSAIPSS